ncbi:uncharacterized protein LOC114716574 [Neltuma alba]|uniref:uncharacterized protein LOC114716574 n=1 Tax=Neltuma alba TaxID=207710 RepID=UPI0010A356CE|nr:uncharacterized protein LOC114716574 [Prosopis alba]
MVSFHKALAESPRSAVPAELEASSKRRKREESSPVEFFNAQTEAEKRKSTSDNQQLYPSPRINMNTPEDPKNSLAPPSSTQISLDLELNLTFDQSQGNKADNYSINKKQNAGPPRSFRVHDIYGTESSDHKKDSGDISHSSSSRMSAEGDHREMVATVCMRCHMLVMLRMSSPACPNCKFMHPPDQNPPKFLKRKCSLLC